MASDLATQRCPHCKKAYPPEALVCPTCRTILAAHSARPRTPAWVIALFMVTILALLGYITYLAHNIFVLHQY